MLLRLQCPHQVVVGKNAASVTPCPHKNMVGRVWWSQSAALTHVAVSAACVIGPVSANHLGIGVCHAVVGDRYVQPTCARAANVVWVCAAGRKARHAVVFRLKRIQISQCWANRGVIRGTGRFHWVGARGKAARGWFVCALGWAAAAWVVANKRRGPCRCSCHGWNVNQTQKQ